ncbi:MAG: phosphate transport system permease protein [Acidimicrobiaceae bacterium]|jgi:phosphate transport system permease protein|nr:phosphate transport system permease protein [Acidimicrobiaceae bacterium]MDQ1441453.1 phosphate transport system permease protein [Acidimicrobiaceae bacterium]
MSAHASPGTPAPPASSLLASSIAPGRRFRNRLATSLVFLTVAVAAIPLLLLIAYVVQRGGPAISSKFLTKPIPPPLRKGPGMGPAIVGTLVITFWATVIAVPLGILGAIYVTEYGAGNHLARVIRFMSDVMAGVPSIVMGLFIFTAFTLKTHKLTGLGGSLALACLMLPIVIRSTESMLALVPRELREASYALGTTKSRTVLTVVMPAALPGITSGCLLAIARAAGETAPLLFTIGALQSRSNWNAFKGSNTTLSAQIFVNASQPFAGAQQRAWGAALTLIVMVLVLTVVARIVSSRLTVKAP